MKEFVPHMLIELGLVGGLFVIAIGPFPGSVSNYLAGGALFAVAIASVAYLVVGSSNSGGHTPDF